MQSQFFAFYRRCWLSALVLLCLRSWRRSGSAEEKSQKTLFVNGFNAAAFGTVFLGLFRCEWDQYLPSGSASRFSSLSLAGLARCQSRFEQVRLLHGVLVHQESFDGEDLKYDAIGPGIHFTVLPQSIISVDVRIISPKSNSSPVWNSTIRCDLR